MDICLSLRCASSAIGDGCELLVESAGKDQADAQKRFTAIEPRGTVGEMTGMLYCLNFGPWFDIWKTPLDTSALHLVLYLICR